MSMQSIRRRTLVLLLAPMNTALAESTSVSSCEAKCRAEIISSANPVFSASALLPFGVAQFGNDQLTKGIAIAGTQIFGISSALYFNAEERAFGEESRKFRFSQPNDDTYRKASENYEDRMRKFQIYGFGVFGVAYLVGVADALFSMHSENQSAAALGAEHSTNSRELAVTRNTPWRLSLAPVAAKDKVSGLALNLRGLF